MKTKTSITLSSEILYQLDMVNKDGNRSSFIEKALWQYMELLKRNYRNNNDLQIINEKSTILNKEAEDVLIYQVNI
jgi:metal-responsive CopG/Arc/MetJ family transcriptional regulator